MVQVHFIFYSLYEGDKRFVSDWFHQEFIFIFRLNNVEFHTHLIPELDSAHVKCDVSTGLKFTSTTSLEHLSLEPIRMEKKKWLSQLCLPFEHLQRKLKKVSRLNQDTNRALKVMGFNYNNWLISFFIVVHYTVRCSARNWKVGDQKACIQYTHYLCWNLQLLPLELFCMLHCN